MLTCEEVDSLSDKVAQDLVQSGYCGGVSPVSAKKLAREFYSDVRIEEQIKELRRYVDPYGKQILEVGSGYGYLIAKGHKEYGWNIWGIEPGADAFNSAFRISQELLALLKIPAHFIVNAVGENIPFSDESFDIVYSTNVLEHVRAPKRVIDESIRVLKPGGILQFVIPNYGSWWEGHYGVVWLPKLGKRLGKLYVRLYGRDPSYIDTLQLGINRRYIENILNRYRDEVNVLGWGVEIWEKRLSEFDFSEWASLGKLKKLIQLIHRLGLAEFVVKTGKRLHWETPFILTIQKKKM